jgi:hypothetical protein
VLAEPGEEGIVAEALAQRLGVGDDCVSLVDGRQVAPRLEGLDLGDVPAEDRVLDAAGVDEVECQPEDLPILQGPRFSPLVSADDTSPSAWSKASAISSVTTY